MDFQSDTGPQIRRRHIAPLHHGVPGRFRPGHVETDRSRERRELARRRCRPTVPPKMPVGWVRGLDFALEAKLFTKAVLSSSFVGRDTTGLTDIYASEYLCNSCLGKLRDGMLEFNDALLRLEPDSRHTIKDYAREDWAIPLACFLERYGFGSRLHDALLEANAPLEAPGCTCLTATNTAERIKVRTAIMGGVLSSARRELSEKAYKDLMRIVHS